MRQQSSNRPSRLAVALSVTATLLLASEASAFRINADFGATFGTPSSAYGAASSQVGSWDQIDPTISSPQALLGIDGMATGVAVSVSGGEGLFFGNDPTTGGNDQALLDDELDVLPSSVGGSTTVTISGLFPGIYTVYTYARDADTPVNETVMIDVNGSGGQIVQPTSNTFTGFAVGETHAEHTVTLANGQDLVITSTIEPDTGGDFGMINGFQIIPEPSTGLLLAAGLVFLIPARQRDRRR